ncbi:hypothetical protein DICVIV_11057 [Dictyocaulus viviparus]|uniref:Uncharacterized protein n=1 Tax=Dictyocaulus viviparus TaxID=29172 RepID=A0A0D8XGT2_DICVI|nr:hypothetical protein DICVIV_11057 [Dictyocaulus viviparus]
MELPFVYIDPHEENEDIANVAAFLGQARRIIVNNAVSEEMKRAIFDLASEYIVDVRKYYQAKEKEALLVKRDADIDEKLHQVERELAEKERINNALRASIEEKKRNIKLSEITIKKSRNKTSDLFRQRKELEEDCKKLDAKVKESNSTLASSLQTAHKQRDRLQMLMEKSPRLAKQITERDAVNALEVRLEQLKSEQSDLKAEEERLRKELELQTATPLRVFIVNFAKITLRTLEMQEKLGEARKVYEQLKAEETERLKSGVCDHEFDASFLSTDYSFKKVNDHGNILRTELMRPAVVSKPVTPVDDGFSTPETLTSGSSSKSSVEPPQTTEEDIIKARTNAVKSYVTQQSETVARNVESSKNGYKDTIYDENERESIYCLENADKSLGVMRTADKETVPSTLENNNIVEIADDDMDVNVSQGVIPEDFSDEDGEEQEVEDDGTIAVENENDDVAINTNYILINWGVNSAERILSQESEDSTAVEGISRMKIDPINTLKIAQMSETSQSILGSDNREKSPISQKFHENSAGRRASMSHRQGCSSQTSENVFNGGSPSPCVDASQEAGAFFSNLLDQPPSPIQDGIPFNFGSGGITEEIDPSVVLNISTHSNDPGGDFLLLMENEKRERDRRSEGSSSAAEFSFSMFGTAADPATSGLGGEFAFDFDAPSQCNERIDSTTFQFNFSEGSNDQEQNNNDGGFNFFDF